MAGLSLLVQTGTMTKPLNDPLDSMVLTIDQWNAIRLQRSQLGLCEDCAIEPAPLGICSKCLEHRLSCCH